MPSLIKQNKLLFCFSVTFLLGCSSNHQSSNISETQSCESFLKANSLMWKEDSLGLKGEREKFIDSLFKICNFKGELWSKFSNHFGSPFSTAIYDDSIFSYKYRINYFEEGNQSTIGNIFLMVEVVKDTVTMFKLLEVDG